MTREEAIKILTEIQTKHKKYIGQTECNNALNMAIEALSADAVTHEMRTETHECVSETHGRWEDTKPEPIRINLNELIKVKLTDLGKEIYYHQYDRTNQIVGREICKPKFPKEDENGYTEFQLWCFINLYGEHMGISMPNVIKPLEIVYER